MSPDWDYLIQFIPKDELDLGTGMHDQKGFTFLISQDDIPLVMSLESFNVGPNGYVYVRRDGKRQLLHRLILKAPQGIPVDHVNRERWDNRRSNLRLASIAENNRNGTLRRNNKSGFKGVAFDQERGKWTAYIGHQSRTKSLGRFDTPVSAAVAYDEAARKSFGSFAALNFPREGENGLG